LDNASITAADDGSAQQASVLPAPQVLPDSATAAPERNERK
jgi:hypothetical protein